MTEAAAAAAPPPPHTVAATADADADASVTTEDASAIADALLRRSTRERAPPPLYQPTLPGVGAPSFTAPAAAAPAQAAPPPAASAATIAAAAAKAASLLPRRRNARLSSHPLHATLSPGPQLARRSAQRQRPEFFSLPASTKAAVFSALADSLLETRAVRSELNLRESEGWFVSGARGGAGGSGQMWASVSERDDAVARGEGNYDACVLCGYGGSLLCCDACPGAYHFKCLGIQPQKLKDDEDWICLECEIGGRGESAGLRVPCAGVDRETGCASWVAHCALLRGARAPRAGTGAEALEGSSAGLPMEALVGEEAKAAWRASEEALGGCACGGDGDEGDGEGKFPSRFASTTIVRQRGSERPQESTLEMIARGEQHPLLHDASTTGAAETYKNRYGNGWASAVAVYKAAYDECARRRGRPTAGLPQELTFSEQAEPMPLVKFAWPASQGKGLVLAGVAKCGRCETCTNPNQRKACLAPVLIDGGAAAGVGGAANGTNGASSEAFPAPPPLLNVKLQALINFTLKLERDVSPLLEGPWGGGGSGGGAAASAAADDDFGRAEFRRAWAARLREASSVGTVASALLQIEAAARRVLRSGPWRPVPPIRLIPGKPFAEPPRIARTPGGWMVDATGRRRDSAPGRLPASHVRRAARKGTNLRIPQIDYYTSPIVTPPHLAWRRDVAAARSTAALAVQARVLADALLMQYLRRPEVSSKKGAVASAVDAVAGDAVKAAAAAAAARRRNTAARRKAGGGGAGSDGDDDSGDGGNLADVWSRTKLKGRRPCPRPRPGSKKDDFLGPTFEYLVELPDDAPAEGCTGAAAAATAAGAAAGTAAGGIKVEGGNFVVAGGGGGNPAATGGGLYGAVAAACADGSLQIDGATTATAIPAASAPPHAAGAGTLPAPLSAPVALAGASASAGAPSATVAALARYRAALAAAAADVDSGDERGVYVSIKIAALGRSGKAGVSVEVEVLTAKARAAQQAYDLARAEVLRASGIREEVVQAAARGRDPVSLAKHLAALTVHGYTPAGGVGSGFMKEGSAGGGDASGGGEGGATTDSGDDDDGEGEDTDNAARDGSRPRSSSRPPAAADAAAPPSGRVSVKRTAEERRRLAASASTASRRRRLAAEEVLAALAAAQLPPPPTGSRMRGRVKQAARWAALPMRELSSRATRTRAPGLAPEAAAIAARGMLNPNSSKAIEGIAAAAAATRAEEDRQALRKKRAAQFASAAAKRAAGGSRALAAAVAQQHERRGPGRPRLDESEKKRRLELRRLSDGGGIGAAAGGSSRGVSVEGSDMEIGEGGAADRDGGDDGNDDNNTLAKADAAAKAAEADFLATEKEIEAANEELYDPKTQLPYLPSTKLSWVHEDRIPIWLMREFEEESRGGPLKGTWKPALKKKKNKKGKKDKKSKGGKKRRSGVFGDTSSDEDDDEYGEDSDDEEEEDDGLCAACGEGEKLPGEDDEYLTKKKVGGGEGGGGDEGAAAAVVAVSAAAAVQALDDEPEATTAWIGCEGECGKWFHARCANVTPEQYRALSSDAAAAEEENADGGDGNGNGNNPSSSTASWVCPPCLKKQAAKDARKLAKEASRSGMSDADRQRAAREAVDRKAAAEAAGRAAKEMGKQAKLALKEHRAAEKAREKEQRAGAKAAAAAERQALKEAEKVAKRENKKRRMSSAGGGGSASKRSKKAADLVCSCRGPEVDGDPRGFVQCEGGCSQWFHPVCVGESMAGIEARGEDFQWSCPGCVGRGEVLAAKRKSAQEAAGGGNSPSFHAFLPPLTPQAALAAKQVVDAVASSAAGRPFSEPVPLDGSVFQYKELIAKPMDLGTISQKLALTAGAASSAAASLTPPLLQPYSTLSEVLDDVALVWHNCATYNLEGSPISRQAAAAAEDLRKKWWLASATAGTGGAALGLLRWHSLEGALVTLSATQAPSGGDYEEEEEEVGGEGAGVEAAAATTAKTTEAALAAAAALALPLMPPPAAPASAPPLVVPMELQQLQQPAHFAPMELQQQQQAFAPLPALAPAPLPFVPAAARPPFVPAAVPFAPAPPPFVPAAASVAPPPPALPVAMPVDDGDERRNADAAGAAVPPPPPPDFLG